MILDVKPGNILHDVESDSWKLIDFDSAVVAGKPAPCGTPCYVAPELAKAILENQILNAQVSLDIWRYEISFCL